jgi:hypothetical protein
MQRSVGVFVVMASSSWAIMRRWLSNSARSSDVNRLGDAHRLVVAYECERAGHDAVLLVVLMIASGDRG